MRLDNNFIYTRVDLHTCKCNLAFVYNTKINSTSICKILEPQSADYCHKRYA